VTLAGDIAIISLSAHHHDSARGVKRRRSSGGTLLFAAGYGGIGIGTNCCDATDNKRRSMTTEFGALVAGAGIGYGTAPFLSAQFRNPANPFGLNPANPDLNIFTLTVPTSQFEGGTVGGDSGSPVFIMTANGLVQIGVLSGGGNPAADEENPRLRYGDVSAWTPLALYLDWLAQNNPLRQVTAAGGNFNWSNSAAWIDAFPDPARPNGVVPDNTRDSVDFGANTAARYYRVAIRVRSRST
jgi:hypothetical protein